MSVLLFRVYSDVNGNTGRPWLLPTNIRNLNIYASFMMYFRVREQDCPHRLLSPQAPILKSMTEFTGKEKSKRKGKKKYLCNLFRSPMGNLC